MPFALPPAVTDYVARAALVEGYSSNTYQTSDISPINPAYTIVTRHPSLFTGLDGQVEARITNGFGDLTDLRLQGRVQHYEPIPADPNQSDDGTINAAWTSRLTLNRRTFLSFNSAGTLTTINGSHLSDGTIFQFDPTQVRNTYWISSTEASITYELSPTWRIRQALGLLMQGTVSSTPTLLPNGQLTEHRGVDFVQPFVETDLFHDFTERATGDILALYQYSYNLYVLDLTQNPPRNIGPDKLAFLTATAGYTYRFSPELVTSTRAGGTLASAPPRDVDQRPVVSPSFLQEASYTMPFWQFIGVAAYTYGSVNPRLGTGPSASASALLVGTPYRRGRWRDFSTMINAQASYSTLLTGIGPGTNLGLVAGSAELRYAFNPTWGLLAGYDVRYATFTGSQPLPPFMRHLFFIGVSGYWSTDKAIPVLTQFAAPVVPL